MRHPIPVAAAALLLHSLLEAAEPPALTREAMAQAAESFYSLSLDPAQVYPIARAHLQRDRLGIDLEGGALVLAQPILGRITGACYSGRARLSLAPTEAAERASLKARAGSEALRAEVEALYLRFNDTTVADLTSGLKPAADPSAVDRCSKLFSDRNGVVHKYEERTISVPLNLELDLLESLLSPTLARDFFLLEADLPEHRWLTYALRPGSWCEVSLLRLEPVGARFEPELWMTASLAPDPAKVAARRPGVDIVHSQMEIVIPNRSAYTIDALISWRPPVDTRSARFSMINSYGGSTWDDAQAKPVTIDSVAAEDGVPLPFVHRRHELLVGLPAALSAGQTSRLRIRATEKTIWQITPESYGLLNTYPWFPQETEYLGGIYTLDWTVKVLRPLRAAGSGLTVREWEEKKLNCAQWKSDIPVSFPSLIFGQFRETNGEYRRKGDGKSVAIRLHWMPRLTLTDMKAAEDSYVESAGPNSQIFNVPVSKPSQIVKEASSILDYFEQVLGPYPNEELDIAQMGPGMWFGQAPPGLVQITAEYFLSQGLIHTAFSDAPGLADFLSTVLAHEIAHHYWGDVVRWQSEQDQWLSESLAEYTAGLYLQASEGDKRFHQKRESWRKMADRWEGDLPIIHAHRASGDSAGDVYQALLYNKGPLILHMLRTQIGNDNFVKALKGVLAQHSGKAIDTADFQRVVEAVAGYKMDWFFDQWVRGTGIPELRFSYTLTPREGKFLLNARLTQADRANPKALFLPVVFQFQGDRRGEKEWRVKGAEETLQLMLPEKPLRVLLDEPGDLLAKIVYETGS